MFYKSILFFSFFFYISVNGMTFREFLTEQDRANILNANRMALQQEGLAGKPVALLLPDEGTDFDCEFAQRRFKRNQDLNRKFKNLPDFAKNPNQ